VAYGLRFEVVAYGLRFEVVAYGLRLRVSDKSDATSPPTPTLHARQHIRRLDALQARYKRFRTIRQ